MVVATITKLFYNVKIILPAAKNCTANETCNYEQNILHCKKTNTTINHLAAADITDFTMYLGGDNFAMKGANKCCRRWQ